MRKQFLTIAIAASALLAANAQAFTATNTFGVSATVNSNCLVSANALAFGAYSPTGGAITGSTTVGVRCTSGTTFTVALNGGTTTGATITQRLMANGANTLQYNLYTTNAYATVWGDGATGSTQAGTGAGMAVGSVQNLVVYGQLPDSVANQAAVPGNYSDTITITVTY